MLDFLIDFLKQVPYLNDNHCKLIIKVFFGCTLSYILTWLSIPKIIRVSIRKHLVANPEKRSSHTFKIPNLGGVGMFYGIIISVSIFSNDVFNYVFLLPSMFILFFTGVMDDILVISPKKKLYAQILTATLISVGSQIRIDNFFGVLGIYEINYYISILFTISVVIFIINSFNLIDGIDGLAGGIGIIASVSFAVAFYKLGSSMYEYAVFCLITAASLLAFLYFNLSKRYKVFMGDTGSLLIGFILSFFMIRFLDLFINRGDSVVLYHLQTAPAICVAIFIIPISDTLSVILIRLLNGKRPFQADKNHIHHRYLDLGLTHKQTSLVLLSFNVLIIIICYICRHMNVNILLIGILILGFFVSFAPAIFSSKVKFYKDILDNKKVGIDI
ncbi:MAG: undecaprenyl/decaprenyl-phosphate alpha-N-acetylglucosaminyl 1-phosphate transferase [Flavobacteriales bacterium]|nr:undecaprenyl/decaprenyl-phosphate alpha-N-acetylglucosaminyl 1-phosphate transferase [Flavobacteriales bacterium]